MRVWFIPCEYLDSKRLVAAHTEIHSMRTCAIKSVFWGPTRMLQHSLHYATGNHFKLVIEMAVRKAGEDAAFDLVTHHPTAFTYQDLDPSFSSVPFVPTRDQLIQDVKDLRLKWDTEGYYYGVGRWDLRTLERQYGLPEGIDPVEAVEIQGQVRALVRENKRWFDQYRTFNPKSRMQDRIQAFLRANPAS